MEHGRVEHAELRVAIAGMGAIGQSIAAALAEGIPGIRLTAIAQRDKAAAAAFLQTLKPPLPAVLDLTGLASIADIVIECAPASVLAQVAEPVLKAGKTLIVLSSGALLAQPQLLEMAKQFGGRILVPGGALGGLDAVAAMAEGSITSARLVTSKPSATLRDSPYLLKHGISVDRLEVPLRVFCGSATDAVAGFPANLNVAAALAFAGIGPDRTEVELWADPKGTGNIHRIEIESDAGRMSMTIEGVPSANPKTSRMAAQSVLAMLRKMRAPLRIGA